MIQAIGCEINNNQEAESVKSSSLFYSQFDFESVIITRQRKNDFRQER